MRQYILGGSVECGLARLPTISVQIPNRKQEPRPELLNKSSADLLTLDILRRRELGLKARLPRRSSAALDYMKL
jgi:hypothetical protein